jgi:hypothetical protein
MRRVTWQLLNKLKWPIETWPEHAFIAYQRFNNKGAWNWR